MTHDVIFQCFRTNISRYSKIGQMKGWYPLGKNCIMIEFEDGQEFIFTYHGENNYSLETVKSFVNRAKGALEMC